MSEQVLAELVVKADVPALNELLGRAVGDEYRKLHTYLQRHAQDMADVYGFSLQTGDFMFEELVYLLERQSLQPVIERAVEKNDYRALERYFEGGESGLRAPMLIFELLCMGKYSKNWPFLSQWLYYCFLRLAEKRDPRLLLSMVKEAYPQRTFWKLFAQQVSNALDVDFLYLHVSAYAAFLIEEKNYYPLFESLDEQQKVILFAYSLRESGFTSTWANFPSLVKATFNRNYLRWLEDLESDSFASVAQLVVQETADWDRLLELNLKPMFWESIAQALKENKNNTDERFYKEVNRRVQELL